MRIFKRFTKSQKPQLPAIILNVPQPSVPPPSSKDPIGAIRTLIKQSIRAIAAPNRPAADLNTFTVRHLVPATRNPHHRLNPECPICKERSLIPLRVEGFNICKHTYCQYCITTWMTSDAVNSNRCPLCRTLWFYKPKPPKAKRRERAACGYPAGRNIIVGRTGVQQDMLALVEDESIRTLSLSSGGTLVHANDEVMEELDS